MKQSRFRVRPTLLLPLAVVAAVLLLLLRGPQEGTDQQHDRRKAADTESAKESTAALKPESDHSGLPRSVQSPDRRGHLPKTIPSGERSGSDILPTDSATQRADQAPTDTAEPYVGAASFQCVVPDGGAMLTGGWAVPNGGHAFALISPRPVADSDGHVVSIAALVFELPDEELTAQELNTLLGPPVEGLNSRGASLDSDEVAAFREAYASKMTRILSSPSVTMPAGEYAAIQVSVPSGGVMLGVIAERATDGSGTEVAVSVAEHRGISDSDDAEHSD